MPVTGPCKNAPGESPQPQTAAKLRKKDFLNDLRRTGIPEETIKAADEQLHNPVDHERDGIFPGNAWPGPRPARQSHGRQPVSGSTDLRARRARYQRKGP